MTGQVLKNTWVGNRAELLAIYALSNIAAVTHVRRENDFGFDLLCTLLTHHQKVLRAGRSFGIQVKSVGDNKISYGGLDKHKKWKGYEIEWLFSQGQPIIIALADTKNWRVRLYSTTRILYLRYQIGLSPSPGEIVLLPDQEIIDGVKTQSHQWRYKDEGLPMCADGAPAGNGFSYQIPLGPPIVDLSLDSDDDSHLVDMSLALDRWLGLEYANILQRDIGVPTYAEWRSWQANQMPGPASIGYSFWNSALGVNIPDLLTSISPATESLLLHLRHQGDFERAQVVVPLARWLRDESRLGNLGLDALRDIESNTKEA